MKIHIPEPEESFRFSRTKKENPATRWGFLFLFVVLMIILAGLIKNGFRLDFSEYFWSQVSAGEMNASVKYKEYL